MYDFYHPDSLQKYNKTKCVLLFLKLPRKLVKEHRNQFIGLQRTPKYWEEKNPKHMALKSVRKKQHIFRNWNHSCVAAFCVTWCSPSPQLRYNLTAKTKEKSQTNKLQQKCLRWRSSFALKLFQLLTKKKHHLKLSPQLCNSNLVLTQFSKFREKYTHKDHEKKPSRQGANKMSPQIMVVIKTCFTRQEVMEQPLPAPRHPVGGSAYFRQALLAPIPFPTYHVPYFAYQVQATAPCK